MKLKKIAVFLPAPYRGGSMQGAKNLAKMLKLGSKSHNEEIEVVFSCLQNTYDIKQEFSDLINLGITVRETEWKVISKEETQIALDYQHSTKKLKYDNYILPTDGINNFIDCNFWLIVSDRTAAPVAPVAPYGMVIYDYIQRYIPDIFGADGGSLDIPFIQSARNAELILCTTPQTRQDAIQYAGVQSDKVVLAPMEFNPLKCKVSSFFEKSIEYFIWTSNPAQHKNHINALKAIDLYYKEFDGKLKIFMSGAQTEFFQKNSPVEIPSIVKVREMIQKNPTFQNNLTILGELSENQYISVLSGARFLFHPVLIDNGTFSVIEAAYHSVPSVSSNYPQMQYINERFSLGLVFFDPREPRDIAKALKYAEDNTAILKKNLPSQESLEAYTYEKLADEYWVIIRNYL